MVYQYDAFFSYKRDPHSDTWHEAVKDKLASREARQNYEHDRLWGEHTNVCNGLEGRPSRRPATGRSF